MLAVPAKQDERQKQNCMIGSPSNESPVGAMPETAQQENDKRVANHLCLRAAAAAQRNIDVIAEPCRQRNVPPAPKLGNVAAEIRNVEIAHKPDTEQLRRSDGNVGIAREVAVNLEGEKNGSQKQCAAALVLISTENLIHINGTIISHHDFLEQAPKDLLHAVDGFVIIEFPRLLKLRQEICGTLDRSSHQLRKETHESEKLHNVMCRLQFTAINVNAVAQGLENVETDADRQNDFQQQAIGLSIEKQIGKGCDEKVVVLENA